MALALDFFIILLFYFLTILSNAQKLNQIKLGSSLTAGDDSSAWTSSSGDFVFGFRHLDNQNLFLLAIWYDKIPDKTIVWYANGASPAPKGSKIELTSDGKFSLSAPNGQSIWKAENVADGVSYASLLDTGNFVLAGENYDKYMWESFRYPSDTILPTQVLDVGGVLSSRMTKNNYSKGQFQLRLRPDDHLVLNTISSRMEFVYDPPYYKSGTSDTNNSMNSGFRVVFNETGYIKVIKRNGVTVNLTLGNIASTKDFYHKATLDFDGIFTQYAHPKNPNNGVWDKAWFSVWYEPKDICTSLIGDLGDGACGFNSICAVDVEGRPTCECIPGFSRVDSSNQYSGCNQEKVQKCNQGSRPEELFEMQAMNNAFWPFSANYESFPLQNEEVCNSSCFNDCNCVVAVVKEGTCWKKKLPLSHGRLDRNTYGKALVKIPKVDGSAGNKISQHPNRTKKDQSAVILVVSILLGGSLLFNFIFVATVSLVVFFAYRRSQRVNKVSSLLEMNLRVFTFQELQEATEGFHEEVGKGSFGTVYKGIISTSTSKAIVAVKKLERLSQDGEKEFKTEAGAIAKTHHKNLVRLLGFCDEGSNRLLVYEFMSNGTLASFLFGISRPDWNKRLQMAYGIARGLMYLHEECSTQIIHCDIKPQNILLDDTFTTKISDFGLAKLLGSDQTRTSTVIRGTKGYVAPEWFRNSPVTAKVDVYSYGVMLLEILCCRRNIEMERDNEEEVILVDYVYDCYKERVLEKLVVNDEEVLNDLKRFERLVMVGIWCIQEDHSLRPNMKT
ncbi:hypothetical protein DCAR_0934125 [Daucus carota subsp. sativus]|uniref:Receptor-like serine/threonine-protein kinase n=1 Tax=Daucus carota subsp. sativus TaxID=79200 RepID=A0A175YF07_DAUCS|nr:hypothetical protein DCAR_0934125 [Daucus carota subsp. sativus]